MSDKTFSQADLDAAVTAAVATARTEATAQLNAAKAEHDTALQAATATGAKAERERIKSVLGSEEAKGREKSALHFAMTTSLSVDECKAALAGVAKDTAQTNAGGPNASHGLFLSEQPNAPKAEDSWADVVAKVNQQNKPR